MRTHFLKKLVSKASLALTLSLASLTAVQQASADAILHAFDWKYSDVTAKATEIKNLGYKAVLVAPPLKSNASNSAWWQRYQPQDIRVIDHARGNKESFQAMISALNAKGVAVYADIVLNHMANERYGSTDFPGAPTVSTYVSNSTYWNKQKLFGDLSQGIFSASDFNSANCIGDYNDVWQVQNWRMCGGGGDTGLPDLNPNSWVVTQQRNYLTALKSMGVKGFRVDAAKHMTAYHLNQVFTSTIKSNMYVFGEIITGGGAGNMDHDRFLSPYLRDTDHKAYDFPLFHSIRNAFSVNGSMNSLVNPQAVGQAIDRFRAVTFTINHDIPLNDGFRSWIMNSTDEKLAYAYIFGRDGGNPLVFSDSTGTDSNRWVNAYKAAHIGNMIKFHNQVQGQGMEVVAHNSCAILFRRGEEGIVGINKCTNQQNFSVNTNNRFKWNRNYRDVLTGNNVIKITSSSFNFALPGREARMWLPE